MEEKKKNTELKDLNKFRKEIISMLEEFENFTLLHEAESKRKVKITTLLQKLK